MSVDAVATAAVPVEPVRRRLLRERCMRRVEQLDGRPSDAAGA
ncbi:hypothetical protein ACIBP6_32110 [Nonomuraea terrae]